jgi:hypothetical protein
VMRLRIACVSDGAGTSWRASIVAKGEGAGEFGRGRGGYSIGLVFYSIHLDSGWSGWIGGVACR